MEIIHRSVFYLKHCVSETGLCLRIQVEFAQLGAIERTTVCLRWQGIALSVGLLSRFHLTVETESSLQIIVL
jgi:hypothetical protein